MAFGSLRARLLLLLAAVFAILVVTDVYQALERRRSDTHYIVDGLQAQARLIAEQQGDAVRRTESFLEFMTASLNASRLAADPACASKLQAYIRDDEYLANVFFADLNGRVICEARLTTSPVSVRDRAYYLSAFKTPSVVAGEPVFGRMSGRWVLPFARRYLNANGEIGGVLVVALDLGWVSQTLKDATPSNGVFRSLVTSKGIVLAHQPDPNKWIGRDASGFPGFKKLLALNGDGTAEASARETHDGIPKIYTFVPFAKTNNDTIYLWQGFPKEIATAKANNQFQSALELVGVLVLASFFLAWFGGYHLLVRPIEAVVQAARRIAGGDLNARTGLSHSSHEIGQLAGAFDTMAGQVARIDVLTGLPNLRSFEASLASLLDDATRQHARIAVIRLQIREFDHIVGAHGLAHSVDVSRLAGQRLQRVVGNAGILARVGDGNFAGAFPAVRDAIQAIRLVENIQAVEREPIDIGGLSVTIKMCFGVSFFPEDGRSADDLLQSAGMALNLAHKSAISDLLFYEQEMNARQLKRIKRPVEMRQAIEEQSFELHYQPQQALNTGRLVGVEALVRWNHAEEGQISPAEFIGLAEESGLIIPLGDWILQRAVTQLAEWRSAHPALSNLVMAVNISAIQLACPDFQDKLVRLLAQSGLPPGNLELEITESVLMSASSEPEKIVRQLKDVGVLLSIDDFGTGYSSLSYLKHLAADKLKIDKSFVDNVISDPDDMAIVEATIAMAHKLGLAVIAEGVESAGQADELERLGCDQIQGYLLSKPMPAGPALEFLCKALNETDKK
ncbi:bifunctional diguanylate cyclase/phosphodiesterase [Paraburkholderia dinghuensis]|uniref:EAL domain-containing protein n=1 Tax=Paraburkholderia dinghuensis TaxID=2305225 RepID=A0A3N6PX55_9BURK|nr:EAL domain-containing protein [Paraburkholderia dinghuensis]RQH06910.1 EAL domain-containing protein [Paraburkholderia dinghuensis]